MHSIEVTTPESHTENIPVTPTSEIYFHLAEAARQRGADIQQPLDVILAQRRYAASLQADAEMYAKNEILIQSHNETTKTRHLGHTATRLIGGFFER